MRMLAYLLRRILLLVPVLIGLTILVFAIIRLLPGDPARLAAGPNATPSEIEQITHEFRLDKPLPVQYWDYVDGLAHGDWGMSIYSRRPVLEDLEAYLPATLELVLAALILAVALGIPLGLMAATYRNRWPDALTSVMSIDAIASGHWHALVVALRYLCLPAIAMSLSPLATIIRMMRASTIEVLQQDYVLTERALGLPRRLILFKYVLKNAVSATLTVIGLYFGWLLGGTVLVETVFDWPGIGLYATSAVLTQDFMPIIGVTLCTGTMFVVVNLIVDIAYAMLNPRVRLG
jgi:peptide/nickel transport system permease protein